MKTHATLFDMMISYLDNLRESISALKSKKDEALQFWQFVTLQDLDIYSTEEIKLYERNLRKDIMEIGISITEENVIRLIHERDVESVMHPGKETYTQRMGHIIVSALESLDIKYKERHIGFDILRMESVITKAGVELFLHTCVIRPEKAIAIRVTVPSLSTGLLEINEHILQDGISKYKKSDGSEYCECIINDLPESDKSGIKTDIIVRITAMIKSVMPKNPGEGADHEK